MDYEPSDWGMGKFYLQFQPGYEGFGYIEGLGV